MTQPAVPLWRVVIPADALSQVAFAQVLDDIADALSAFELAPGGPWQIEAVTSREPDRAALGARIAIAAASLGRPVPAWSLQPLPQRDWLAENRRAFPPRREGRFFIRGTHDHDVVRAGALTIELDASIAFGSGEHATTRGCLRAIDGRTRRRVPRRALDLGCGSGILAVALAKAGCRRVTAIDIDADAVRLARENAQANGVAGRVQAVRSARGPARRFPVRSSRYELVVANILARPLCRLSPVITRAVAKGGTLVLSGLLAAQEAEVLAAYRARRRRLKRRIAIDGWHTLVLG
jgi:ribosomal protein L11 methyltransferase